MKIIILHGLYMHGLVMKPLADELRTLGYRTKIISYNSVAINERRVFAAIDAALDRTKTNILLGHSLGGIVIKRYLASRQPSPTLVSHVVTLGSPLKGASITDKVTSLGLKKILGNSPEFGLNKHHDQWEYAQKLGSIAGTTAIGMRSLLVWDDKAESDGTVTVDETKIDGMTDHIEVSSSHTSMIYSSLVPKQIDHFIKKNEFEHEQFHYQ